MSGGQYSVARLVFGGHIFLLLLPACVSALRISPTLPLASRISDGMPRNWMYEALALTGGGIGATIALCLGVLASVALTVGWRDGVAALVLIIVIGLIGYGAPFDPGLMLALTILIALLVFHATTKPSPYLSVEASKRVDPSGGWSLSPGHVPVAWLLLGGAWLAAAWINFGITPRSDLLRTAYTTSAVIQVLGALSLLVPAARPYAWAALLLASIAMLLILGRDLGYKGWLLHLITFNPAWIAPRREGIHQVFFDASCGLCHASTRFLLAEDPHGAAFRFAPLDGETYQQKLPATFRERRPDSVVVLTDKGRAYTQYRALLSMGASLGGLWGALAWVGRILPAPLRAPAYNVVAKTRNWFFPAPTSCSPHVAPGLLQRFDP